MKHRPVPTRDSPGLDASVGIVGENDFGNRRYDGPDPPGSPHTYRFKLFALDAVLDLGESATVRALGRAMAGHVLATTELRGEYAP